MANFIGVQCPVCEQRFADGDDVVVCPVCGTPHHRTCYQKLGACSHSELHAQGYAWEQPEDNKASARENGTGLSAACPTCGAQNAVHCLFCSTCGTRIDSTVSKKQTGAPGSSGGYTPPVINAYTMAFGGLSPTEELEGVSVRDLANFIGPSAHYFLPQFKLLAHKTGVSLNFPSLIFSFFYFFYRKMYLVGLGLLALILLSQLPFVLIMPEFFSFFVEHFQDIMLGINVMPLYHPQNHLWVYRISGFLQYVPFILTAAFSFFANRLYFSHAVKKVKKIRQAYEQAPGGYNDKDYSLALAKRGRTTILSAVLLLVLLVVGYFALSYLFLLPHQDQIVSMFMDVYGVK